MSRPKKLPNGIEFSGWRITTSKGPIANGEQLEQYVHLCAPLFLPCIYLAQFFLFFSHPLILQTLLSAAFKRALFFERVTRGRFEAGLKLPVLPEEVYNGNRMVFEHVKSGERIEVSNEPPPLLHHGSCTPCTTVMSDSRCTGNVQRACVRHTVAHTN